MPVWSWAMVRRRFVSVLVAGFIALATMVAGPYVAPTVVHADTLGYPWPTDTEAPCEFGSNGGSSCTNPNDPTDKYDWGVYISGAFHQYRNGYEYRNCTDYVQWKESTVGVSVPTDWGNGGQWYSKAPTSEQSTTPKAWDAAVVLPTTDHPAGHVAFIESVNSVDPNNPLNDNITVSEYNHDTNGHGDIWTGKASDRGFTKFVDFGVHPSGSGGGSSSTTATTTTSVVTPDGAENFIFGDSAGAIQDISWGNGVNAPEHQVGTIGSPITHMTAQVLSGGVVQVAISSGSTLYQVAWGNGVQPSPSSIAVFPYTITALSSRVTSDGAFHAYVAAANAVWNVSWGNGTPFVNVQVASSESANVVGLSNQLTADGYQNVYAVLANGYVMHIYWTNPYQSGQWQPGTVSGTVVGIASQLVNGVTNIQVATSTAVTNFRYGNGAPFSQNTVGTVSSMTITAIDSAYTSDGNLHAVIGTSSGNLADIYWTVPSYTSGAQTQGVMNASGTAKAVVGLSVLVLNGVLQANGISADEADNLSWWGVSPTLLKKSTGYV